MLLQVEYTESGPTMITPEIIDRQTSYTLKEVLVSLTNSGYTAITIDFSQTVLLHVQGIGKLLVSQKNLKEMGGELRIKNVAHEGVRELFQAIRLHEVIPIEGY